MDRDIDTYRVVRPSRTPFELLAQYRSVIRYSLSPAAMLLSLLSARTVEVGRS